MEENSQDLLDGFANTHRPQLPADDPAAFSETSVPNQVAREPLETEGADESAELDSTFRSVAAPPLAGLLGPAESTGSVDIFGYAVTPETEGRYDRSTTQLIGQGGLGRVLSTHDQHLRRDVAVKEMIFRESESEAQRDDATRRFVREARVTARLDHPSIVPIYELGQRLDGSLYYVMRLVHGRTLENEINEAGTLEKRLGLLGHFVNLCNAIAYAHSIGVVHRDLKPNNVMVGQFGETMVLDWGTAKLREDQHSDHAELDAVDLRIEDAKQTAYGTMIGTPFYMSPEQVAGEVNEIDEASDTWSLGIALYQLVTATVPYEVDTFMALISKISRSDLIPMKSRCPNVPPELVAIVDRCVQVDKAARYPSAKALADDVEAFRTGGRVSVYRYTRRERVMRFVARHRIATITAALSALALVTVSGAAYINVVDERDRAVAAERASRMHLAEVMLNEAKFFREKGRALDAEVSATASLLHEDRADARGFLLSTAEAWRPQIESRSTIAGACARSGLDAASRRLLCEGSGTLTLVDTQSGAQLGSVRVAQTLAGPRAFSRDLITMATTEGGVLFWRAPFEATPELKIVEGRNITRMTLADDGALLAVAREDGSISVWNVSGSAQEVASGRAGSHAATALAFSDDKLRLVSGDHEGWISSWAFASEAGDTTFSAHVGEGPIVHVASLAKGGWVSATAQTIRIFAADQTLVASYKDNARSMAVAAQGTMLLTASESGALVRRGVTRPITLGEFNAGTAVNIALDARGERLIVLDGQHLVTWALAARRPTTQRIQLGGRGRSLSFCPGSGLVALSSSDNIMLRGVSGGQTAHLFSDLTATPSTLLCSNDGKTLLGSSKAGVEIFDVEHRIAKGLLAGTARASESGALEYLATSRSGQWMAFSSGDAAVTVLQPGKPEQSLRPPMGAPVSALSFLGESLIVGMGNGEVVRVEFQEGSAVTRSVSSGAGVTRMASDRRGTVLVVVRNDGSVSFHDRVGGLLGFAEAPSHALGATAIAVADDGNWVAVGQDNGDVLIFDISSRRIRARFAAHQERILGVAFAPEGDLLLTTTQGDGAAQWDLRDLGTPALVLVERLQVRYGASPNAERK